MDILAINLALKGRHFSAPLLINVPGLVAQWITRLTMDQKIPGSNPGELESPILRVT